MSLPIGMTEAFKRLALARTDARDPRVRRRRVWIQDLYEEAVRDFLIRLQRRERVFFAATPLRRKEVKTLRLEPALWTQVKEISARFDVSVGTVVRTACSEFLEANGITLDRS